MLKIWWIWKIEIWSEELVDGYQTVPYEPGLFLEGVYCLVVFPIGHVRYINILAWLRGFRVKIANFSSFFCLSIPKRDLDTKKTTPNIEVWPESLGAMLEYWYIERGLFMCTPALNWRRISIYFYHVVDDHDNCNAGFDRKKWKYDFKMRTTLSTQDDSW